MFDAEHKFNPDSIAIALVTRYQDWYSGDLRSIGDTDKVRGDLALESIGAGIIKGYRVVIGDGGSSDAFEEEVNRFPDAIFFRRQGRERAAGKREVFQAAGVLDGVKAILRTEPEKVSVVDEFAVKLAAPILQGRADIVWPNRNPDLLRKFYPRYQWESEVAVGERYNSVLNQFGVLPHYQYLDVFFGPTVISNDPITMALFQEKYEYVPEKDYGQRTQPFPEDYGNAYLFPLVKALHLGMSVPSVEVDFVYPSLQRQNEETVEQGSLENFIAKRREQRFRVYHELTHFIRLLKNDPKSALIRAA